MTIDWYERCDELEEAQIYLTHSGDIVKLDRRVPGDGTDWYVADWTGRNFSYTDTRLHPGELSERLKGPPA